MLPRALSGRGQWMQIAATILFAAALTALLMVGIRRADTLQAASSALQRASELTTRPQIIRAELTLIQRGLETTTYVGESLRGLAALRESSQEEFGLMQRALQSAGLASNAAIAGSMATALTSWQGIERELGALNEHRSGALYSDTSSGSELTPAGRALKGSVDGLLVTQAQSMQRMGDALAQLSGTLRTTVADEGASLRGLLLSGSGVATLLLGLMLYYAWRGRQSAAAAATAQRQVANILSTVREGLFLVGRDMRLGATCSDSLTELLRLPSPAGRSFEEVLAPLVDDKTLSAALKFLGLLWKDKVHEELIESVNPLSQIEVSFAGARGGTDVRYLAFAFRRVRGGGDADGDYILGAVSDVTDRVLLGRELEHAKADNDSQAALLLQLLRVDPTQLQGFLGSADVAFRKCNAMLTAPGIEQDELRKKLNGVFRELHAVKGEAAALGLSSFVQRIHAIEDGLAALRGKGSLTGNDFVSLVVQLDELMSHVAVIHQMQERVAGFRPATKAQSDGGKDSHADTTVIEEKPSPAVAAAGAQVLPLDPPPPSEEASRVKAEKARAKAAQGRANALAELLCALAGEVAAAEARTVRVKTRGFEQIPDDYAAVVKDICVQMVRNAVAHGIETPQVRGERGKIEEGTVQISFAGDSAEDYLLVVEDDGRGLSYEGIVDKALRQGLLRPQQAMSLDKAAVYRLIFQPGFSTADQVSEHAGRGVGLDTVSALVREHGGRIGVSTIAGQYTRFKILLPKAQPSAANASSAA